MEVGVLKQLAEGAGRVGSANSDPVVSTFLPQNNHFYTQHQVLSKLFSYIQQFIIEEGRLMNAPGMILKKDLTCKVNDPPSDSGQQVLHHRGGPLD